MQKKPKMIAGFISLVALTLMVNWMLSAGLEATDDAMVEAHTVPISPKVSGYIASLAVKENYPVNKGDIVAEIDARDYQLRLQEAQFKLISAEESAKNAAINAKRQLAIGKVAGTQKEIDNALASEATTRAAMDNAKTQLAIAEKDLTDTKLVAPNDGIVAMRTAEIGAYVNTGKVLFVLVTPERWVVANFKEVQITKIRPGQKAKITIDAYPEFPLTGHVDSLQCGTGARFSAFPPENATGNFVKVVQRVPVKILIDSPLPPQVMLGPGLSVQVTVYTSEKANV